MSTDWDFVEFRDYVIRSAKHAQRAYDQASLAKITGIDTGLLGRYFRGETQPGEKNLERIHEAIPGTTMRDLRVLAGRAKPSEYEMTTAPIAPPALHPRAEKVDRLLGPQSPLTPDERQLLDTLLDRVMAPYDIPTARRKTG